MPIGELEIHPYLDEGQINPATKLILGSFPVYECTNPENNLKAHNRLNEGTVRFFYGSVDSAFWMLYQTYIDNQIILPPDPNQIILSLAEHQIAIADTIYSCERHNYSSEDTKLINRTYNIQGVQSLIRNGVQKILCTSKGVLKDLERQIILSGNNHFGQIMNLESCIFQNNFITDLDGNNNQIINPIAKIFLIDDIRVTALAIPSPGSSQRQLAQFGFNGNDWNNYANNYFSKAFDWLIG